MRENWPRALSFNLAWEGGSAVRKNEPGGAVNKGLSLTAYREFRAKRGYPITTIDDLMNIPDSDVSEFYRERANRIGFDDLPSGYDLALFNASTMQGVKGALELHEKAKGDLGHLIVLHMQKKLDDPNCGWHTDPDTGKVHRFGPGWAKRLVAVYEQARALSENQEAVQPSVAAASS